MRRRVPMQRSAWERKRKPSALRPRKPIPSRNPKRQAKEFARTYHSKQRKRWIAAHACLVCGAFPSVNAHTRHPSSGTGYKADYCAIVPLCLPHEREKHRIGEDTFNLKHRDRLCGRTLASWAETFAHAWTKVGEVAA